jgi:hypothetical protein
MARTCSRLATTTMVKSQRTTTATAACPRSSKHMLVNL